MIGVKSVLPTWTSLVKIVAIHAKTAVILLRNIASDAWFGMSEIRKSLALGKVSAKV